MLGQLVGQHVLAQQRLGDARTEELGDLFELGAGPAGTRPGGEACICNMTEVVGLSQSTVSHHMRQLVEAGIVTRQRRGKWAYYAIVTDALNALSGSLTTNN